MCPKTEIKRKGPFTLRTITRNSEPPKRFLHPPYKPTLLQPEQAAERLLPLVLFSLHFIVFIFSGTRKYSYVSVVRRLTPGSLMHIIIIMTQNSSPPSCRVSFILSRDPQL